MDRVEKIVAKIKSNARTEMPKDVEWEEFKLCDILLIENAKNINSNKIKYVNNINLTPHISRQVENNAVKGFVEEYSKEKLNKGNCLCIDMFLNTTWQERDFLAVDHVLTGRNKKLNKNIALFLKVIIEKHMSKFSYSNIFCKERGNFFISLPSKNHQPDWEYMDQFIEDLRSKMKLSGGGY